MRAFITDPEAPGSIRESEINDPTQESNQVLVRVSHFSLNRGEIGFAASGEKGRQIGWDIAGVVEKAAPDGSGPQVGERVVAFSRAQRGWAELVAIPVNDLATVPEGIDLSLAATLPVAGLTALYALERGERILGSRVLVTGATGGVGNFAVVLARLMGAEVVAQVRKTEQVEALVNLGADSLVVDTEGDKVAEAGPYRLVIDGLGNSLTSKAIHSLTPDGVAVLYGVTAGYQLSLNAGFMLGTGRGRVEGFNLYRESEVESVSKGLDRLLRLLAQSRLPIQVERKVSWSDTPATAQALMDRKFAGKAVVEV